MSENEQTGSAGPGQPPRGEPDARTATGAEPAVSGTAAGTPDIPWAPPPRRAEHGKPEEGRAAPTDQHGAEPGVQGSSVDDPEDETAVDAEPGTGRRAEARRTRSDRRAAAAGGTVGAAEERDGRSHPFDGMDPEHEATGPDDEPRRQPWVLWAVIGGAVAVVVAAVLIFALLSGDDTEPAARAVTTTMDVPTSTTEPLDRSDATVLVQALPGTVRQFVLGSVEPDDALDGALEGWTATYSGQVLGEDGTPVVAPEPTDGAASDGATEEPAAGAPAFTVTVGQWADAEQAAAGAQALAAELGEPSTTEDVTVGGDVTGSMSYYATDSATGTAVWTNGTVAIRAVGPSSELVNFATAFGL